MTSTSHNYDPIKREQSVSGRVLKKYQFWTLICSKIKEFVSEIGESNNLALNREVTSVTKNVVTEVNLAGYRRTKSKLIPSTVTIS